MAQQLKISATILNVRLHPHSPERYIRFIRSAYRLRHVVKIHGDRFGMLSTLNSSETGKSLVSGLLTTFTKIDRQTSWFDSSQLQEATDSQVSQVQIPPHLFPNAATFYFLFDANNHKLYVQTYSSGRSLSPNSVLAFFRRLADDLRLMKEYGEAQITLVQSSQGLEELFSLRSISRIDIVIQKPNADVFSDDFEEEIEKHLAEAHSKKMTISYEAEQGGSLTPTKEIMNISEIALENGLVTVGGRDDTGAVTRSSEKFPRVLQDKFDPDAISEQEAFRRLVGRTG